MQCKDISTVKILAFLKEHSDTWCTWGVGSHFMPSVADVMPEGAPLKLQMSKMSQLFRRGLVTGCDCGCRGDYEITQKGLEYLEHHSAEL